MSHILITYSPKAEKFKIYAIITLVDKMIAHSSLDASNRDEQMSDNELHTTKTIDGAIVHAMREATVLPSRINPDKANVFQVVIDPSVAEKLKSDGYTGDPIMQDT
jgi:hypothetical protein